MARNRKGPARDIATENYERGCALVNQHPMFAPLMAHVRAFRSPEWSQCPKDGWAVVTTNGAIHVHPTRRAEPEQWQYVLCHCLLHLGFGHFQAKARPREWNTACDAVVARFLSDLKIGRPPVSRPGGLLPTRREDALYDAFLQDGVPEEFHDLGTGAPGEPDMVVEPVVTDWQGRARDWTALLAAGLSMAVTSAVEMAAGMQSHLGASTRSRTHAQQAKGWFISTYPLLGSLAAAFEIIEDPALCQRMDVSVAAVDPEAKELIINPAAGLDAHELRFVMAHELLHVGLRHAARRLGRDPFLWNVACDYVINGWLLEMGVGELPGVGALHDPDLKGLSAEAVYDRIVSDLHRCRKLCTFRGIGKGDMLERGRPDWWRSGDGLDLDGFYRRCLTQGLVYHQD